MNRVRHILMLAAAALFTLLAGASAASAQTTGAPRFSLEVEGGPWGVTRNDVRIPAATGTDFSMLDLTGRGPDAYVRVAATFRLAKRHQLRLVASPVQTTGTGTFTRPVVFVDQTFAEGVPTEGTYKFNTYRVGYRYTLYESSNWRMEIGAALLTRDARIEVSQTGRSARDTDLGFVPLASFAFTRRLAGRAALVFDVEGLGSSQGRAIDSVLKVDFDLGDRWTLGAGYRTIEGGADVDSVYTFAWLHFGVVSLRYKY